MAELDNKIGRLQGPILVLGASGFIGANLLRLLVAQRDDVVGTAMSLPAWRLEDVPQQHLRAVDLLVDTSREALLAELRPRTVFNCVAYGAYSFERDSRLIYQTNFLLTASLVERLAKDRIACYVHAGSSSEYGDHAAGPSEDALPSPNSDYAVSKVAAANLLAYYGKHHDLPCVNLRLYSVYGPLEDASRLVPNLVRRALEGGYPEFVRPDISRDFVYVDDACQAFIDAAIGLQPEDYGSSFNIGSGCKTTIGDLAAVARDVFSIDEAPVFTRPARDWDVSNWFANPARARERLGWEPSVELTAGLARTAAWYAGLEDKERYERSSRKYGLDAQYSVSAIVACYRDNQAIPIMYDRLRATFTALNVDYEIVFVNDNSPDDSEEVIRAITRTDRRVVGLSHARNFGSQAAFRSGMEIATKNACVLLDGDLQDPPELIADFVAKWRDGYDVVYGRRVKREAPILMQVAYKAFYRLFDACAAFPIPHDAGDFGLMDRRVVQCVLQFPERDLFLRGVRAYVGFRQTGVDYVRPERVFGRTTNSLARNIGWAKKGIFSFSNAPLTMLSYFGSIMFIATIGMAAVQAGLRVLFPALAPRGVTTLLLAILFFGSVNLLAIGLIGEYIARIFEEVKQRPRFIRRSVIRDGEVRSASLPAQSIDGR